MRAFSVIIHRCIRTTAEIGVYLHTMVKLYECVRTTAKNYGCIYTAIKNVRVRTHTEVKNIRVRPHCSRDVRVRSGICTWIFCVVIVVPVLHLWYVSMHYLALHKYGSPCLCSSLLKICKYFVSRLFVVPRDYELSWAEQMFCAHSKLSGRDLVSNASASRTWITNSSYEQRVFRAK